MGQLCGVCNTYQPRVQMITVDSKPAFKASDVIAVRLGCGHIMGEQDYEDFKVAVRRIKADLEQKVRKLNEEAQRAQTAAFVKLQVERGVSQ
jgi:hypothetical protein